MVIPAGRLQGVSRLELRAMRTGMASQARIVPVRVGEEVSVDFRIAVRGIF